MYLINERTNKAEAEKKAGGGHQGPQGVAPSEASAAVSKKFWSTKFLSQSS
jgi:hypothetical protein